MKQINFNDKMGFTRSVIDGHVTQTRLVICSRETTDMHGKITLSTDRKGRCVLLLDGELLGHTAHNIGETVAVAQSFQSRYKELLERVKDEELYDALLDFIPLISANNTADAKIAYHHICIRNVRVERMQDISKKDCLAVGIRAVYSGNGMTDYVYQQDGSVFLSSDCYGTAREAYKAYVDRVYGQNMWKLNPYVVVYDFELID